MKHGFQVFLWNYRGYGRSTGKPSPEVIVVLLNKTLIMKCLEFKERWRRSSELFEGEIGNKNNWMSWRIDGWFSCSSFGTVEEP